jgi:hypothetical protein
MRDGPAIRRTLMAGVWAAYAAGTGACGGATAADPAPQPVAAVLAISNVDMTKVVSVPLRSSFALRALGNRCLDVGAPSAGSPVVMNPCNGSTAQQLFVQELDGSHDFRLQSVASTALCVGVRTIQTNAPPTTAVGGTALGGSTQAVATTTFATTTLATSTRATSAVATVSIDPPGLVTVGSPLELEACGDSPGQRFAYDGDSLLVGTQGSGQVVTRQFVIEPASDHTRPGTALVVGTRDLSDAEYLRLVSTDGTATAATAGFWRVVDEAGLDQALAQGWGTVIEINTLSITLSSRKHLRAGVTLRGTRKQIDNGPELVFPFEACHPDDDCDAFTFEDHTRVTGLRLRGPSRSLDEQQHLVFGLTISSAGQALTDVLVDHVDISDWTGGAINVVGPDDSQSQSCPAPLPAYPRPTPVRILRNFVHHNARAEMGYGIVIGNGAFALVDGNVAYMNRHSISADPWGTTGYVAADNFILSSAPVYSKDWGLGSTIGGDIDVHGSGSGGDSEWVGGISDDYVDVGWNTFLGTNRVNFDQRGVPCRFPTTVHDNIYLETSDYALSSPYSTLYSVGDTFTAPNPTADLAVADFDGDGLDDVFVGTGAAWYFSSGGKSEWRLLNRMPEHASQVRLGDFDGDGRADVLAQHNGNLDVSWGGVSAWQTLNVSAWALSDLAVGDFDGDHRADLFLATGAQWFIASAGGPGWTLFANQPQRTGDVRFGDFDHDGRTDVFGVTGNQWSMVPGATGGNWQLLRSALTTSAAGLVVADFDGDGYADVARSNGGNWEYAARGWGGFVTLRAASGNQNLGKLPEGQFDGNPGADVIIWDPSATPVYFQIAPRAQEPVARLSNQDMR